MYNNTDVTESKSLPLTLSVSGFGPSNDVTRSLNAGTWTLLGNPFNAPIDVSLLTSNANIYSTVQVWQDGSGSSSAGSAASTTGSFVLSSSVELGGKIAAWQGFILASDDATEITIPMSAKTTGGTFLREQPSTQIEFTLSSAVNNALLDKAAILQFHPEATSDWDRFDLAKLGSLNSSAGLLYFVGERAGETIAKAQDSQSISIVDLLEIPMDVAIYGLSGEVFIEWPVMSNISDDLTFSLVDNHKGTIVVLEEGGRYTFSVDSRAKSAGNAIKPGQEFTITGIAPRFILRAERVGTTSVNPAVELPQSIALDQNYPNPFNPTTRINYQVPASGLVRVAVYDLLGREVAVLVDGAVQAGSQFVNFDASALSSGVYIYRLSAGGQTLTRKMTLVK
jgi:hypothetical protein